MSIAALSCIASCGKDEPEVPDNPDTPDVVEPDKPVADPVGTVTINVLNNRDGYELDSYFYLRMDEANNFYISPYKDGSYSGKIVSVGKVAGLGNITTVPAAGWKEKAVVDVSEGYVAINTYGDTYARIYVMDYMTSTTGGIMGTRIKYQCPFQMPIKLSAKSVEFKSTTDLTQTVELLNPTVVTVESKPDWVEVKIKDLEITLTASTYYGVTDRNGKVILKNDAGTSEISVRQIHSDKPLFAGGSGSEEDPYLISTAQQLDNIRVAPDAHFKQTVNINLTSFLDKNGNGWEPIQNFSGSYDGNMKEITGMWISLPNTDNVAMFNNCTQASFKRIILKLSDKGIVGRDDVAALVSTGKQINISQCSVEGNLKGIYYLGQLAGIAIGNDNNDNDGSSINECRFIGNLDGGYVFGLSYRINANNSYVIGDITASKNSFAFTNQTTTATNCYIIGSKPTYGYIYGSHCYGWGNVTDEKMKKKSTYEGWDFTNIWTIDEGKSYPQLRCFSK